MQTGSEDRQYKVKVRYYQRIRAVRNNVWTHWFCESHKWPTNNLWSRQIRRCLHNMGIMFTFMRRQLAPNSGRGVNTINDHHQKALSYDMTKEKNAKHPADNDKWHINWTCELHSSTRCHIFTRSRMVTPYQWNHRKNIAMRIFRNSAQASKRRNP